MRTGEYCISSIDKLVEMGCITPKRAIDLKKWQKFRVEHPEISGLTEGACKPLMREKNLEVQAKALEVTGRQVSRGPRETALQIKNRIANIEAGKGLQGGEHLGKAKDEEERKFGDFVKPVEPEPEENDFVEVDPDVDDQYEGGEPDDSGDIPDMPREAEVKPSVTPGPVIETPAIEEDVDTGEITAPENPELTEKVIKEYLKNAGHQDPVPPPKKIPTEDEKQTLFDKAVAQAIDWEMDGDEIFRRTRKAIMFAVDNSKEET